MKTLKNIFVALSILLITSCTTDEKEIEISVSDIMLSITAIKQTSAKITYTGNYMGSNPTLLYRAKNSTNDFQPITITANNEIEINNLLKATEYEVKFQVSNSNSTIETKTYSFNTKAVLFNYEDFYNRNSGDYSNSFEVFSHLNKRHVLHASGLSDYNNVKVFLVNEQKTDSLEIATTVVSDSLSFIIPATYLSQTPRESLKKAWIGVKINDSYEYLLNSYGWVNTNSNPNFSPEKSTNEAYLKLKIFNTAPYINSANLVTGTSANCPNYTVISLLGDFLGFWDAYYWTPQKATLTIFDASGNIYNTYTYDYGNYTNQCDVFGVLNSASSILSDGILNYHQRKKAQVKISNLPSGSYSAKIIFTFNSIADSIETNTFNFTN